ncbi:YVTN repeat-like/Quino protein amine dehydrogenase [Suillus hirtellus]|nr:YVTN repeat-like/Quino protein amine dehydrogenase [Suillus hirtellus]
MASSSTQPDAAENKSILTPVMFLEGHKPWKFPSYPENEFDRREYKFVSSICYFPDGKQMISRSGDKTIRRWDLRDGKEIKEVREVYENRIDAVGVSRDGRWIVTAGDEELKVNEVETGIVRIFHIEWIGCIDISADSALLVGGTFDGIRIWRLDTGELVAGPFKTGKDDLSSITSVRLSEDSRKLAVSSNWGQYLQVWDVQAQKLLVQRSSPIDLEIHLPVFWTTKDKSIVAAFSFTRTDEPPRTIYEFDASTLKTVGAPFEHNDYIYGLALSSDCVLLASSSYSIIKLWAFESRQLLASFDISGSPTTFVLSPDSRQLAYTTFDDTKIFICDIPTNVLASIGLEAQPSTNKADTRHAILLNADATPRPVRRKPVTIPVMSPIPRPLPTRDPHARLRFLRKLFSRTDTGRIDEPNPLNFPATSPLPRPLPTHDENSRRTPAPPTTQSSVINNSLTLRSNRLSSWWHASPTIVDVPLAPGRLRYAAADAPGPDDELIRDEDYVSPPSPNPGSRPGILNSGQHGSGRFCLCF